MAQPNPLVSPPFFVIPGISPSAPVSAQVEQIDQLNTLLLQEIDANFARFHQIVTTRILPEIKRFAIAGEPVREGANFWRSFFEAAAAVRVPLPGDSSSMPDESSSRRDDSSYADDRTLTIQPDEGDSFLFDPQPVHGEPFASTPMPAGRERLYDESWEESMESPFVKLDRRLDDLRIGREGTATSDMPTPSLPSGYDFPNLGDISSASTGTAPLLPLGENSRVGNVVEHDTPRATTTKHNDNNKKHRPPQGVTDLRSTPLNAKFKQPKSSLANTLADLSLDADDDLLQYAMSPPVTMKFNLPARAQAVLNVQKTPAAKAIKPRSSSPQARLILDDLMSEMSAEGGYAPSPRMPTPEGLGRYSILPSDANFADPSTKLFQPTTAPPIDSSSTTTNIFQPKGQIDSTTAANLFQSQTAPIRRSMANTSYGSDILTHPSDPGTVITDDESFDIDEDSFDSLVEDQSQHHYDNNVRNGQGEEAVGADDTYLTMSPGPANEPTGEIFRGGGAGGARDFQLKKVDEMMTFNGGRLEDAILEDSPLHHHQHHRKV
ncbi:DASH complex subunit Ask1-domain-containing protein [Naematelia encephala]|uniref:DASH complex subunit ASK1 n=1 Tax=Naematelia encephala TaxID=71784 RepID=A0A1Y2B4Z0_9TREE|nr:DASH complex subunit Ask1-domain-containing protein [Naematelia encephala]